MIKRSTFLTFLVLVFYPLFITIIIPCVFRVPFDTETIGRFIIPFQFQGNANIPWAVMESTQWEIFRPVYSLSFLSDYALWGTDNRMYHMTDLILSWLCYCMVFFLLKRRFGFFTAALTVCLWTVHPSQPMSLLKMFGRNDRLVTLFTVAALLTYDMSLIKNERRKFLFTLTLFFVILATLSKDTGIFYALLLPAWSILGRERSVKETVRSDHLLWSGLLLLAVLFIVLRSIVGFGISIDSEGINFGYSYLLGLSILIQMGIPLISDWNLDPYVVCIISTVVVGIIVFCRKCPGTMRFGAFAFSVFIFPFPFYWVQETYLWGYWLWASLALAGGVAYLFDKYIKHWDITAKLLFFTALVITFSLSAVWSTRVTRVISSPMIEMHETAMFAVSSEDGPVYSEETALSINPALLHRLDHCYTMECSKIRQYIIHLIQVETGNPASTMDSVIPREN